MLWATYHHDLHYYRYFGLKRSFCSGLYFWGYKKCKGFPDSSVVKNLPSNAEDMGSILGSKRCPKELTIHSSIPAWEIPWTEEPGGLQSRESQESDMTEQLKTTSKNKKRNQDYTLNHQSPCSQLLHCIASYEDLKSMVSQTQRKAVIQKERHHPRNNRSLSTKILMF